MSFEILNLDILFVIITKLSSRDVYNICTINKFLYTNILENNEYWKRKYRQTDIIEFNKINEKINEKIISSLSSSSFSFPPPPSQPNWKEKYKKLFGNVYVLGYGEDGQLGMKNSDGGTMFNNITKIEKLKNIKNISLSEKF